jgi:hypothetical protein
VITSTDFMQLLVLLDDQGRKDIEWAENCCPPKSADEFALEVIYVICNSGMKFKVARGIYDRVVEFLKLGTPVKGKILGKSGKAAAIDEIWRRRQDLFSDYIAIGESGVFSSAREIDNARLELLAKLPWIGQITKYHCAKNFGADVAKPDVHLQRLADREKITPQQLCERLASETGYRVATVDTILWRACALGILNSSTGAIHEDRAAASAWH